MTEIVTFTPNPAVDVSACVERVVPTRKLRCTAQRRDPGGGGINVARTVKRMGSDVTAVFARGGSTGQLLSKLIEREGVAVICSDIAEETREDFSIYEDSSGRQYRFVLPGPTMTDAEWQACLDQLGALSGQARFVVASGSLPPGVPDDFYARAGELAKLRNAKFILDTSGAPMTAALKRGVYLFKPNLRELSELIGENLADERDWVRAAKRVVERREAEIVVLTLGHRGALLVSNNVTLRAEALAIKPLSAVGAGDSFLGAMTWALASGKGLEEALRYGTAAGSSALLRPGTELCEADETHELARDVVIHAL
jgi:6-phosphofructokinase 2